MIAQEKSPQTERLIACAVEIGKTTVLGMDEHHAEAAVHEYRLSALAVLGHYKLLAKKASGARFMNQEIESILDNFFIIETTVFDIANALKKRDFKKLPIVTESKGLKPLRLYTVFREFIRNTKGRVDKADLLAFIDEYQRWSPFSIRELNSVPLVLKLILVEDFGELVLKACSTIDEYNNAENDYAAITKAAKRSSWDPSKITLGLAKKYGTVPVHFGLHLIGRLNQDGPKMRPIIKWIRLNLEKQGFVSDVLSWAEEGVRTEQTALISHITESLHWLNQVRWDAIAEKVNVVDSVLAADPSGAFSLLDLETKNQYRNIVVRLAEQVSIHEAEVARAAIKLASQYKTHGESSVPVEKHIGYYLLDARGRILLEREVRYRPTVSEQLYRWIINHPSRSYFGAISSVTIALVVVTLLLLGFPTHISPLWIVWTGALFLVDLEIAIHVANIVVTRIIPVRRLPRLHLEGDLGKDRTTFVVVPSMLRSEKSVRELVLKLETRFIGNRQQGLYYALLLDFPDAQLEKLETDEHLVRVAEDAIQELNKKYGFTAEKKFYTLIRKRVWNKSEHVFMAWERKRGKLREFNELLRGKKTSYIVTGGVESLPHVRYVITLDEDTELPHDSARRLVGAISHPLNTPVLNKQGKVVRGYGIIQPRVSVRLTTATRSVFSRLYSAVSGIDSYSGPVSDVYQDLFDNALFFGKGVYDIDAVESSMKGKIPDNTVLSHDLLEGIYARVGFASDIVLFDGFPKFYHEFIIRHERWVRGDWQIIGWLSGAFQQEKYGVPVERFAFVDRFKIFDNLRRSVVPVAAVCALAVGYWTDVSLEVTSAFITVALFSPYALPFIVSMARKSDSPFRLRLKKWVDDVFVLLAHGILRMFFLLEQAVVSSIAIVRTLGRLYITRRKLLQWRISQDVGSKLIGRLYEYYKTMRLSVFVACVVFGIVFVRGFHGLMIAWSLLWCVAPFIAYAISIGTDIKKRLGTRGVSFVRGLAYRNALFFIDNAKKETHWLIPDHVQERPRVEGEDRKMTSPTNLGMHISGLVAAYELGYVSLVRYADRLGNVFDSLAKLERCQGHFINWYDVERLEAVTPKYVSSVDSANFLLALIAARQSYKQIESNAIINHDMGKGVADALREFSRDVDMYGNFVSKAIRKDVSSLKKTLETVLKETAMLSRLMPVDYVNKLTILHKKMSKIILVAREIVTHDPSPALALHLSSAQSVLGLIEDQMRSIQMLLPYLRHTDRSAELYATHDTAVLTLVQTIEREAVSGTTIESIADKIPQTIRATHFLEILKDSSLTEESKRFLSEWYERILEDVDAGASEARRIRGVFARAVSESTRYIDEADFAFLYNKEKELFHIGYNVSFGKLDTACYNFMASESNSVSFVAILKNQAPQKHWFYLSRKLVRSGGDVSLVSWGGSLFEYLTSLIFFSTHKESLLGATARAAINVHRKHARKHHTLWGMGESAYASFDSAKRYQYQVFGSPEIGLKRNLGDFLVVAPYVSALSLPVIPKVAYRNLKRFVESGMCGKYGLYDALDYMGSGGKRLKRPVPVEIYYAHHQGFALCSIYNSVTNNRLHDLFHADPAVQSLDVLFEERMPDTPATETLSLPVTLHAPQVSYLNDNGSESRRVIPTKSPFVHCAFISNGIQSVHVSQCGQSVSYYKGIALTRPSTDIRGGVDGTSLYVRFNDESKLSCVAPNRVQGDGKYKVTFQENKAEFISEINNIEATVSVAVDSKNPVTVRELHLVNKGTSSVSFDIASYGEVSLVKDNQEFHHPHYQHILVSSESLPSRRGVLFSRPHPLDRSKRIYFTHFLAQSFLSRREVTVSGTRSDAFPGYGVCNPFAVLDAKKKNVDRVPLDPAFTVATHVDLKPGEQTVLAFVEIASESKDELFLLIKKYETAHRVRTVLSRSVSESAVFTRMIGISQDMSIVFQNIASIVLGGLHGEGPALFRTVKPTVHSLWRMGISGDYPIALFVVHSISDIPTVRQIIQCFNYWRTKGIEADIVILNNQPTSYMKVFDDEIDFLIRQARESASGFTRSTLYQVKADLITEEEKHVLMATARFISDTKNGTFTDAVRLWGKKEMGIVTSEHLHTKPHPLEKSSIIPSTENVTLDFQNTWGGFDPKTGEYVMTVSSDSMPPRPWSHVVAREQFGTILTLSGATYSWSQDSYDNRITTFSNDSFKYTSGETIYIRDCSTGHYWNPTPFPVKTGALFTVRYGFGYAEYRSVFNGISSKLNVFVPKNAAVKISHLTLENNTKTKKTLTVFSYAASVMGVLKNHSLNHIGFEFNEVARTLLFRNVVRNQFEDSVGFMSFGGASGKVSYTAHAKEFFGPRSSYENPNAMRLESLSGSLNPESDSCAVMAIDIELNPGETKIIPVIIGEAHGTEKALFDAMEWSVSGRCERAQEDLKEDWKERLGAVSVSSGDRSIDYLMNGWLLYQAQVSRLFAKTGYYQPSGAYGFRDQIQDSMALLWSNPRFVRSFILKACSKQFVEGDTLTWWHEHNMFGSRTVLSDHQLWLALMVGEYVKHTGDVGVLDEQVSFLTGPSLEFGGKQEWAGIPQILTESGTVYEHVARAIERSFKFGDHGLPLMGHSDWNDGLSAVGRNGKGESVWSAWFLLFILDLVTPYVEEKGDRIRVTSFNEVKENIKYSLSRVAWDGKWYRRAFFDNGTALGSKNIKEFKIDSIAQSWAVLSGHGDKEHTVAAHKSMVKHLLKKDYFALIDPALSSGLVRPGYIEDYPPGIRENGAQYNHAALWAVQSLARIGDIEHASKVLDLINPIKRSGTHEKALRYGVEPYVVASDIYGGERAGQGGWTWYTGSAGVMYRTVIENLFGITRIGNTLSINPLIPPTWSNPSITLKYQSAQYQVSIKTDVGRNRIKDCVLDGVPVQPVHIPLVDDGKQHVIEIALI